MARIRMLVYAGGQFLLAVSMASCSGGNTPRQIAAYPQSTSYPRPGFTRVYDSSLELEVVDVDEAEDRATFLAYQAGGWVLDSYYWQQGGCRGTMLVLAVPTSRSAAVWQDLLDLGTPLQEQRSNRVISTVGEDLNTPAYITIQLQERDGKLPACPTFGWCPPHTLDKAWYVFTSIFSFLLDMLIWIAVLLGLFVLIGVGLWALVRRIRLGLVNRM
jgi:hypothetical protein